MRLDTMRLLRGVAWLTLAVIMLLIAIYVWPTPYRYDQVIRGPLAYPIRTNRFTRHTAYFDVNRERWSDDTARTPDLVDEYIRSRDSSRAPARP